MIAFDGRPTSRPLPLEGVILAPGNRVELEVLAPLQSGARVTLIDEAVGGLALSRACSCGERPAPRDPNDPS